MWGGRFSARPADIMQAINVSIGVDRRLWAQDLAGSRAHCRMLAKQGILTADDVEAILGGLDAIEAGAKEVAQEIDEGTDRLAKEADEQEAETATDTRGN